MHKVIKKFKKNEYFYQLGYYLYNNKVYPCIKIYKNDKLFSGGYWNNGSSFDFFVTYSSFDTTISSSTANGFAGTIKELFIELRKYSFILEEVEKEFESLFLLYKLNNFKKLVINT